MHEYELENMCVSVLVHVSKYQMIVSHRCVGCSLLLVINCVSFVGIGSWWSVFGCCSLVHCCWLLIVYRLSVSVVDSRCPLSFTVVGC